MLKFYLSFWLVGWCVQFFLVLLLLLLFFSSLASCSFTVFLLPVLVIFSFQMLSLYAMCGKLIHKYVYLFPWIVCNAIGFSYSSFCFLSCSAIMWCMALATTKECNMCWFAFRFSFISYGLCVRFSSPFLKHLMYAIVSALVFLCEVIIFFRHVCNRAN